MDPLNFAVSGIDVGNEAPIIVIGGVNVLETADIALRVGESFLSATERLGMPYIFKASFDKANRSSRGSYRGPGLDEGLEMLARISRELGVPVLTDVHEPWHCAPVAAVADIIQIPAFLIRQTELIQAAAETNRPLHLKKMQMMAPSEMGSVVEKCVSFGAQKLIVCERGTTFGYKQLIVDMLGLVDLCEIGWPVTLDVTHSLQLPGALGSATGGRGRYAEYLARAGAAIGIAGIFIEAHPAPDQAPCDGPSATKLSDVPKILRMVKTIDDMVKSSLSRATN